MTDNKLTNRLTRMGRPGSRSTVGYLTADISDGAGLRVWSGVVDAAQEGSANLFCLIGGSVRDAKGSASPGSVLYDLIDTDNLDGLVSWASSIGRSLDHDENRQFHQRYSPVPVVTMGAALEGMPCVSVEDYQGMREAILHLINVHGYRRIAFIRGPEASPVAERRYQAYLDVLREQGIFDPDLVVAPGNWDRATGVAAVQVLLDQRKLRPHIDLHAIATASDLLALGASLELQARNIKIPDEIAVVGFNDSPECRVATPPLTSVAAPLYEQGKQAMSTLLAQLAGQPASGEINLPANLVTRQSCGCLDPTVAQVAISPARTRSTLTAQRTKILQAMTLAVGDSAGNGAADWAERLLDSFVADLKGARSGAFLQELDVILRQVSATRDDVSAWHGAISALRRQALPCLNGPARMQAENLWQQARVVIGQVSRRQEAQQALQARQQADTLREIGAALLTTFDLEGLMTALAKGLPRLGIPSAYISLYQDPQRPDQGARLMLAYDEKGRLDLGSDGRSFSTRQLVPADLLPQDRCYCFVVVPLYLQANQLGLALFEVGPRQATVYGTLREQISSALQGAILVQRVQERSAELARQQYVLDTFMENVPDRIYFKDLQGRITRANRAHAARLGLSDPSDEIGKTDADFFSQEQAQAKSEQEQQIVRTGQPLSLEETNVRADGSTDWSLTTKMPLRDEHGKIIGIFGISRDITDLVRTKQASEAAKDAAEQASQVAEVEKEKAEAARDEAEKARREAEAEKERAESAKREAEQARQEIEAANRALAAKMWQITGQAQLNERMRGEQDIPTLASNVIQQLCKYLDAQVGALYVMEENVLKLADAYAYKSKNLAKEFQLSEGLVGQAAREKRTMVVRVPDDYIASVFSSLGELLPKHILAAPIVYEDRVIGVVELEALAEFTSEHIEFLHKALESSAVAFTTAQARARINELLNRTRQQAAELQAQEEELRAANEELETQTESLRTSEARLRTNQTQLEAANAELEERAAAMQRQQAVLDRQNQELVAAKQELERRAEELSLASKYKSEFLANMSHELRTPLNSLLILSDMLAKNEQGNLTADQVESAQIIYSGGSDLLNLINEILDISKVEAGKMEFRFAPMPLERFISSMRSQFAPLAEQNGVAFEIAQAQDVPDTIVTDQQRVEQIVKNLLSNAFKFTEKGRVRLDICRPGPNVNLSASGLLPTQAVALSVTDTGIGMTPDQQKIVFEAFQQADGSTSRQYGGTGLGLTISRELAFRLGGQIELTSELGKGSTFTLYLPLEGKGNQAPEGQAAQALASSSAARSTPAPAALAPRPAETQPAVASLPDDRNEVQPGDRVLLVVEDDVKFAKIVYDYAHKKRFKCLVAGDGAAALQLVKAHKTDAVVLDLNLPGMSGWEVLDALKHDPDTRHIPVHIMSVSDEDLSAYQHGAMGFLTKPVSHEDLDVAFQKIEDLIARKIKSLLLVEDDANLRKSVRKLLEGSDVAISEASLGQAALEMLATQHFDCMILDLSLPDISGFELLSRLDADDSLSRCPVIVYTGKALTEGENQELLKYADSVIVKGVKSPERLLDETALFLHRVIADMPEDKQRAIKRLHDREAVLVGKTVLIVDDDARNAFALSKLLADKGLKVHIASNGQKALDLLGKSPIDLVLMDIMLPGMDGYEAIRRIREQPASHNLPILALTAKAMKGDREKCIAAGANDYLAKPIDADRLFSMLRVWLSRE